MVATMLPATPLSARTGVHVPRQQAGTDPLGMQHQQQHQRQPLTDRGGVPRRHNWERPQDVTGLYGVPQNDDPNRGRRHVLGPGPAMPLEEPVFGHLRRLPGPTSSSPPEQPAFPRLVRATPIAKHPHPEGIHIVSGAPAQATHIGEIVFGGGAVGGGAGESAQDEFTRLLGGAAGLAGSAEQSPAEGIRTFPEAQRRRGHEEALMAGHGKRVFAGASGQPSPRVRDAVFSGLGVEGSGSPDEQAAARSLAVPAAGREPPRERPLESKKTFWDAPVRRSQVDELLFGRDPDNSDHRPRDIFVGHAGRRAEGAPVGSAQGGFQALSPGVGIHVYPGAAPCASTADELLFGRDVDHSNDRAASVGARQYAGMFIGAAGARGIVQGGAAPPLLGGFPS
mmetsp:Transcript_125533/g.401995  ORF Transcript_125533/g.401995 Transcript_125533/m.401995 type:complete len:395 (-) Transcript_125533:154-1338(-)